MEKIRDFSKNIRSFFKRMSKTIKKSRYGFWITLAIFLVISVFIELFIFNFRHWQTLTNKPLGRELVLSEGYSLNGDGSYYFGEGDKDIIIHDIPGDSHQLYIALAYLDDEGKEVSRPIDIFYKITDQGNAVEYEAGHRVLYYGVERSFYPTISSYGDIKTLRLIPQIENNCNIILSIDENVKIPLFFEIKRVLLVFSIILIIYFFRPSSLLYEVKYSSLKKKRRILLLVFIFILNFASLYGFGDLSRTVKMNSGWSTYDQYQNLAESFKDGRLYLDFEPSEVLLNMDDPYDYLSRIENGVEAEFDTAFYDGRYYVYFGVVPEILFYYPYYLLKGEHLENYKAIELCILLILLFSYFLFEELIKRYYPKCSVAMFILAYELTLISSNILYASKRSYIYNVPIISAIMFAVLGMWAFVRSVPLKDDHPLDCRYLFLGALFTALIAGCRPQLFVVVLIDLVILRKYVFSGEYIRSSDGIKSVVSVFVPMAAVAAGLMIYNYVRFSSPFDFGSNYNLTLDNLTKKSWSLSYIIHGVKVYLFDPVKFIPSYPFFDKVDVSTVFLGKNIQTETFGGILITFPFLAMPVLGIINRKILRTEAQGFYLVSLTALFSGVIICLIDTAIGGIFYRYSMDMALFFTVSSAAAVFAVAKSKSFKEPFVKKNMTVLLIALLLIEFAYCMSTKLLDEASHTLIYREDLYYKYMYMYGFWM